MDRGLTYNGEDKTYNQAHRLFDVFFKDHLNAHKDSIALCWIRDNGGWQSDFISDTYLAGCFAQELYSRGNDVYFGVNPYSQRSRKTSAIRNILRLHVDADFTDSKGLKRLLKLEPTAVIASGTEHRYHAYFNFPAPLPSQQYAQDVKRMNRRLTRILGLKEEAFDLSRTLRVPGTKNFKDRNNPRPVEIIEWRPERRYTLERCADIIGVKLAPSSKCDSPHILTYDEAVGSERGKYLTNEQRLYIDRLLREGLFEKSTRNDVAMLLTRHFYEGGGDKESVTKQVTDFFEQCNNGLSKDWNERPDSARSKIAYTVNDWFKKAYPARRKPVGIATQRLSRRDDAFIQCQALNDRDKLFLRDAMTWILNHKRGDDLILSARQMITFTNCNRGNYQEKREVLYRLGILALAVEHERHTKLANEFKVLYQFGTPSRATGKGRKRSCDISLVDEVDKMLLAGASSREIRERFPDFTKQRIYGRRKRLDKEAAESREHTDFNDG